MRSIWSGTLHLAELSIPVGLAPGKGRSDVSLSTLHRPCRNALEQSRQCPLHGDVPDEELVRAWQVTPGEFVLVEDDELQAAEQTSDEHRLDVVAIVAAAAIEPTMVTNTYFVKPAGKTAGALRAYALVGAALAELDTALVVRFTAWRSDHVAAVRPLADRVLIAQTLAGAEDVRTAETIVEKLHAIEVAEPELELARELVERMRIPFDAATLLVSPRRQRVRELLEAKLAGGTVRPDPVDETTTAVAQTSPQVDLLDALQRSLKTTKKPRRRRAPAAV